MKSNGRAVDEMRAAIGAQGYEQPAHNDHGRVFAGRVARFD
jgi:hypothetical protein